MTPAASLSDMQGFNSAPVCCCRQRAALAEFVELIESLRERTAGQGQGRSQGVRQALQSIIDGIGYWTARPLCVLGFYRPSGPPVVCFDSCRYMAHVAKLSVKPEQKEAKSGNVTALLDRAK